MQAVPVAKISASLIAKYAVAGPVIYATLNVLDRYYGNVFGIPGNEWQIVVCWLPSALLSGLTFWFAQMTREVAYSELAVVVAIVTTLEALVVFATYFVLVYTT